MKNILPLVIAAVSLFLVPSCHEPEVPTEKPAKRTLLIYAVASNNLASYLTDDKDEMIRAAKSVKGLGSDVRVLLYSVASQSASEATLAELSIVDNTTGEWGFETIRSYDRNTFSTDPVRMKEVFADLLDISPSDAYGLVFWSHGTGWIPNFSKHETPESSGPLKSFGLDKYSGVTDYCDLVELADAIPDRMFDFIWFDACYMMGVETVYQLRDKCDYLAGYPSEDWIWGMDYESTLPMLAAPTPNLVAAGKSFFDFYNEQSLAVTVTVLKTDGLDNLATAAANVYAYGTRPDSAYGLQNYSRERIGMYDLRQFTEKYLDSSDAEGMNLASAFRKALGDVILYADCSTKDFNSPAKTFDPDIYSGLSCHFPGSASSASEQYYSSLDWCSATNP